MVTTMFDRPAHTAARLFLPLVLTMGSSSLGCDVPVEDGVSAQSAEQEEIVSNLRSAGYQDADLEMIPGFGVLVQGDALVSLEGSRGASGTRFRHYNSKSLVSDHIRTINVFVDESLRSGEDSHDEKLNEAIRDALAAWNGLGLRFSFVLVDEPIPASDGVALVTLAGLDAGDLIHPSIEGVSDFPEGGSPGRFIRIRRDFVELKDRKRLQYIVMHEMGHAVGLRHTDWQTRQSCPPSQRLPEGEFVDGHGTDHIPGTPTGWDKKSLMNACLSCPYLAKFSLSDKKAIRALYRSPEHEG